MVVGEGIETVLGFARFDGFRADTFYAAAGDLGNLAGKAAQESRIKHPSLTKGDGCGQKRAVYVPASSRTWARPRSRCRSGSANSCCLATGIPRW